MSCIQDHLRVNDTFEHWITISNKIYLKHIFMTLVRNGGWSMIFLVLFKDIKYVMKLTISYFYNALIDMET